MVGYVGVDVVGGGFFGRAEVAAEESHYPVVGFPCEVVVGVRGVEEAEGDVGFRELFHGAWFSC